MGAGRGKLILTVGVPGSGKSTLLAYARNEFPELVFAVSWTTRAPRPGEKEGDVYHFATEEEFMDSVGRGDFIEWVTIDTGHKYGTRKQEILPHLEAGRCVAREVEVMGARNIKNMMPDDVVSVFIGTDAWPKLKERITARAPISEEELEARRQRYERELSFRDEADYIVENREGELEEAKRTFKEIISEVLGKN